MPRRVLPLKRSGHTLQTAAAAFLDRPDLSPASRRSYAQTLQRLTHAIGDDQSAADRVAELDRVPPGTVRRALDASSRIGYAQRPATKDQPTPIEDSPVCLSPPLVGLEDELGALLRIAKKPLPERPERVVELDGVDDDLEHRARRS